MLFVPVRLWCYARSSNQRNFWRWIIHAKSIFFVRCYIWCFGHICMRGSWYFFVSIPEWHILSGHHFFKINFCNYKRITIALLLFIFLSVLIQSSYLTWLMAIYLGRIANCRNEFFCTIKLNFFSVNSFNCINLVSYFIFHIFLTHKIIYSFDDTIFVSDIFRYIRLEIVFV